MALPFFLRQALKRSILLDVETTGLDPSRHAPLGAAHSRFGGSIQETWFTYEYAERTFEGPWYRKFGIKTEEEMITSMEPFSKREWLKSWKGSRADWLKRGGRPVPARKYFSKILARTQRSGGFLWTHNVRFDITQFGSQFAHPSAQQLMYEGAAVPGWTKWDPYSGRVYPTTTRTAHRMRGLLYDKPQQAPSIMREWWRSYRQMIKTATKEGKPAVLDSLAIAQSMLGMAQQRGAMARTGDVFTGTSIEALAKAFGVKPRGPAHLATTDVETFERVLPKILETTETLFKGKPLKEYQASALKYLGEVQPEIARRNVERMFAQAVLETREGGKYRLSRGGYSRNLDDLVGVYKKFYKHRSYYDEGMLEETMSRVNQMTPKQIDNVLYNRAKVPRQAGKASAFKVTQSRFGASMRRFLANRNPYLLAGAAALGAMGAGALMLPDREQHNTVEGLRHEGIKGWQRRMMTDFGSGYNPTMVHPDILRFRERIWSDDVQKAQIKDQIEKLQEAYQAKLGRFRPNDLSRVSTSGLEGFNRQRADIREVNLSRFNIQVEDADTLFLERKGVLNWLKARAGYGRVAMRISGVDAPEIKHEDDPFVKMGLRWHSEQPYGREATAILKHFVDQDNLRLITSSGPETYGRYLGGLWEKDTGRSINLDLIRTGAAKALPWGDESTPLIDKAMAMAAEDEAREENVGLWGYPRYQKHAQKEDWMGKEITFNLLTRIDVLAGNSQLARMATEAVDYDDTISGLLEGGLAAPLRHTITDFGSEYQGVLAVSRWVARFGERSAAKHLTQGEVKDLMVYLRGQIKNSQLLRIGKSSFGLEMSPELLAEHIATLRKLDSAKGYKGGVHLLKQEYFAGIKDRGKRVDEIKRAIMHEGFHSAAEHQPILRQRILESPIPEGIQSTLRMQGYGGDVGALHVVESARAAELRLKEEAAAYMAYPPAAAGDVRDATANALQAAAGEPYLDEMISLHQQHMREVTVVQAKAGAARKTARRSRMTMKTQELNAPGGIRGVRLDHDPHLSTGMPQKMHRNRSRSKHMYQR